MPDCARPARRVIHLLALLVATCPPTAATIVEIGENDFRVSFMGGTGDETFGAQYPAVVYNGTDVEYLVVWSGNDDAPPLAGGKDEIWGQRIHAATGEHSGPRFRISFTGSDQNVTARAFDVDVAFNPIEHQFLVVWAANPGGAGMDPMELEIYAQRLQAGTGQLVEGPSRVSRMGPDGDPQFRVGAPQVVFNPDRNEYFAVWHGKDDIGGLDADDTEIFSQRLDGNTGMEFGFDDYRLSDAGALGDFLWAQLPQVAYNPSATDYLVVWQGYDDAPGFHPAETEIFGQRLDAGTTIPLGPNDFRVSDMGGTGDASYSAGRPAVVYNPTADEYFVVWEGRDFGQAAANDHELFGQRLAGAEAIEVGANDAPLSSMGPPGTSGTWAGRPDVVFDESQGTYLVTFHGSDGADGQIAFESEIFAAEIDPAGAPLPGGSRRLSAAGGLGDADVSEARSPRLAQAEGSSDHLIVWFADDTTAGLADDESEIFGQRVRLPLFLDGFETGGTAGWSMTVP